MQTNKRLVVGAILATAIMLSPVTAQSPDDEATTALSEANNLVPLDPLMAPEPKPAGLVKFDPNGAAVVVFPVLRADAAGPGFSLFVSEWPTSLAVDEVRLLESGSTVASVMVAVVEADMSLNDAVLFEPVAATVTNAYVISLLSAGTVAYTSGTLALLTDDPLAAGKAGTEVEANLSSSSNSANSCYVNQQWTWYSEGTWIPKHSTYGNAYNANDAKLTSHASVRPISWGKTNNCNQSTTLGNLAGWGFSDQHWGKSHMYGTGTYGFGFALSYSGAGKNVVWQNCGANCGVWYYGYEVYASNTKSCMRTPTMGGPVWNNMQNVGLPVTSTNTVPTTAAKAALDALGVWLGSWGGAITTILGYTIPNGITNTQWIQITTCPLSNASGGGIQVTVPKTGKMQVEGEHSWKFTNPNTFGSWAWDMEVSSTISGFFQACKQCPKTLPQAEWKNKVSHVAKITSPP